MHCLQRHSCCQRRAESVARIEMKNKRNPILALAHQIWLKLDKTARKEIKQKERQKQWEKQIGAYIDDGWYYDNCPDAISYDGSAAMHFIRKGSAAGVNPNPHFDTAWYTARRPFLLSKGINPLVHYIEKGSKSGLRPSPNFDPAWYVSEYTDVAAAGVEPLLHFISAGHSEGRRPNGDNDFSSVYSAQLKILKRPQATEAIALFVTYAPMGHIDPYVSVYIGKLRQEGISVVLIIATELIEDINTSKIETEVDGLFVRSNEGLDFAVWSHVARILDLSSTQCLLLTNDSILGPADNNTFSDVMVRVRSSAADLVALSGDLEHMEQIQSFFLFAKGKGVQLLEDYLAQVVLLSVKDHAIQQYELPLLKYFTSKSSPVDALFPPPGNDSDSIANWRQLLARGFPFVTAAALQMENGNWRETVEERGFNLALLDQSLSGKSKLENSRLPQLVPARSISEERDVAMRVPSPVLNLVPDQPGSIAVVCHVNHTHMAAEILLHLNNIPFEYDLFITTTDAEKAQQLRNVFGSPKIGKCEIRVVPNRGRDIAPKLLGCADIYSKYDYCLHLHSIETSCGSSMLRWRSYLFSTLVGSPEIVRTVFGVFAAEPKLGIVAPQHYEFMRHIVDWGGNFGRCLQLADQMGVRIFENSAVDFPSGSMFWARCEALLPLVNLGLSLDDFEMECGQIDQTLAHAIERLYFVSAEAAGLGWIKIIRPEFYTGPCKFKTIADGPDARAFLEKNSWSICAGLQVSGPPAKPIPLVVSEGLRTAVRSASLGHGADPGKLKTAAGIVTYNNDQNQLQTCLKSIDAAETIFVWDNGARVELAASPANRIVQLGGEGNLGFGAGHNRLMKLAFDQGADLYVCINPDGYLKPGSLQRAAQMVMVRDGNALVELTQYPVEHPKIYDEFTLRTPWASGAALAIPRKIYEALGGFDENFFMYCEDVDLSWRARAKGFDVVCCPEALFVHDVVNRKISQQSRKMLAESGARLARKWRCRSFERWALATAEGAQPPPDNMIEVPDGWISISDFQNKFSFAKARK